METLANFGSEAHKQQPRFLRRSRVGREGQCGSVKQPAGGQSSEQWEACLHPSAKKLAPRGLPSTKVYHFTAVEILTSILK